MYGCESCNTKKAEHWRTDTFDLWCWGRLLSVPLDCKEIKPVILKEINPEYSLGGLMLKLQYFGHRMRGADPLENTLILGKIEGQRRRGWQRMRWLDSINRQELEQTLEESEGQGSLACCSPWGHKESQLSNWTKTMAQFFVSVDQNLQSRKCVVMNKKF